MIQTHACQHSYGRLKYVFNDPPHSYQVTDHRVLACNGFNLNMLHDQNGMLSTTQNGAYLEKQFHQSLKRAHNPQRLYQAQTMIISFSRDEFNPDQDLQQSAGQALALVQKYVTKHFSDAQCAVAIQADGDGSKLHAHVIFNTIKKNGKTIATSRFNIIRMRKDFDQVMEENYQKLTGRKWVGPINRDKPRQDIDNLTNRSDWASYLKKLIDQVKTEVKNTKEFLDHLASHGVTVKARQHGKSWTYMQEVKAQSGTKVLRVRDFYQNVDKKTGQVKRTRGLGKAYSKAELEKYWMQRQTKKGEDLNEQSNDEQLVKLKTMAREARARAKQKQTINQLNRRQLQAAEAEEHAQRAQRQAQQASQAKCQQRRLADLSRQRRHQELARRRAAEQQSHQTGTGGPNL
ncbi:relaxase/mobilization nuclease domain-containing protein [uncultured Limosilactobacillus sp.]|uniref:relaxase/mobilization nuclease domain-containing protein n=1 Tax=uncultured Limosilactobacillus sp. TaxID=2837629 RepID=UPI0025F3E5B6|nr:relaxase/mobilization nuclease domain-containing protein [uncultured Limosilactobacillus sp.]